MNEAKIIDEIRTSTGWSMGVIRDVIDQLKLRGLLIDDAAVARVAVAMNDTYNKGFVKATGNKTAKQLALEALFPTPKPDPFEVAAAELMIAMGYTRGTQPVERFKRDWPTAFAVVVEGLRKAPRP